VVKAAAIKPKSSGLKSGNIYNVYSYVEHLRENTTDISRSIKFFICNFSTVIPNI